MPDVLGVVPTLGRGSLVAERLGRTVLHISAVELLSRLANPPVMVVTGPRQQQVRQLLARHSTVVDVAECPKDDARIRAALTEAELVIIHDPLCPLVPASFVRRLLGRAVEGGAAVGVRPVVDTVKATVDGLVSGTVDRDTLRIVSSPLVVAGERLSAVPDLAAALHDLSSLVLLLREHGDVELVPAPSSSRRIEDYSSLELMASVHAVSHRTRERD